VPDLDIYASGLAVLLGLAVAGWLASLALRDASLADSLWPLNFILLTASQLILAPVIGDRAYLAFFLVTLWGTRLCVHITTRNWGRGEDERYRRLRLAHDPGFAGKSLYLVFGLQAVLAWIIALPLHAAALDDTPLGWLDGIGAVLCLVGVLYQSVADAQLAAFRSDPRNLDRVLDAGLWRLSCHPNYFGEACVWWGLCGLALGAGAWWALVSPLLVSLLLVRGGGIALMEQGIARRRPDYPDYASRTNCLVPGPARSDRYRNHGD
jgi:steroid 5-alpha reductase family enzyme